MMNSASFSLRRSSVLIANSRRVDRTLSTQVNPETQSFLGRLWNKYSISGQQSRIELAERYFRAAQIRANDPRWYGPGRIGREFRPRHAMLTMHLWFINKRLLKDPADPQLSLMIQEELFDLFWHDTKARIRAEGVNELTVNKHLKDVQQVTFQHLTHYDHAYTEYEFEPSKRFEELQGLIWMHLLLKDPDNVNDDHFKRMAFYIDTQYSNIVLKLPYEYFREARIGWVDVPDFTGMKDLKGKALPDIPLNPDDILPPGWHKALTDSGKPYYWNPSKRKSQWEKPLLL